MNRAVLAALVDGVDLGRAGRCDLEDKVGRFALVGEDVPVLFVVEVRVSVQRDQQVGGTAGSIAAVRDDEEFRADDGRLRPAEVFGHMHRVTDGMDEFVGGHLVRMPFRRVRQDEADHGPALG